MAGSRPIEGSGPVVNLEFEVLKTESLEANSPLTISEIVINEGNIAVNVHAAKFATGAPLPKEYALSQNYPNPFNPETVIEYQLPQDIRVILRVYDILGQEVATLVDENQKAGYHKALWDGTNKAGMSVASGLYFFCFEADKFRAIRKMIRVR